MNTKSKYRFLTYDASLGTLTGKLIATLPYKLAMDLGYDVIAGWQSVINSIPEEERVDINDEEFLLFVRTDDVKFCVGRSWMVASTIEELDSFTMECKLVGVNESNFGTARSLLSILNIKIVDAKYI